MAVVTNSAAFMGLFDDLGWYAPRVDRERMLAAIDRAPIPTPAVFAYLTALAAASGGVDDSSMPGVSPQQGAQISAWFKAHGLVF